jgi:aryl-alcohol dehydrogenase-like predicted oxidoreductase
MSSKLSLGTVQFGMDYGISNSNGEISLPKVQRILEYSALNGIEVIDTAKGYGKSEEKLGMCDLHSFKLVTKVASCVNLESDAKDSRKKLGVDQLYGLLIHRFDDFVKNENHYRKLAQQEPSERSIVRLGFSLNKLTEIDHLLERNVPFEILQIPYNLLDRRFEKYFAKLKDRGVEIHARSAFLQGLFFMDISSIPEPLNPLKPLVKRIQSISEYMALPIEALALNFVLNNPYIDHLVVGVTSLNELVKNIAAMRYLDRVAQAQKELENLSLFDEELVLPMNWKL